ncbi:hypothetical protein EOE18_15375 [Novosphingobium umbonatum]|uniref:Uncharacterized protein n=1 Tax=Novosphingobium umbonatum TaxID=1908524 RepID=A0A437N0S8_9SPHN|nr:hypothetical protein [Novosphingobium umbonatum]RVU03501.1 hypothetical protein EOE18_15375 [Novosphingobium umbonatum]
MAITTKKALKEAVRVLPDIVVKKTEWQEYRVTLRQTAITRLFGLETQDDIREKAEALAYYAADPAEAFDNALGLQEWATALDILNKGKSA